MKARLKIIIDFLCQLFVLPLLHVPGVGGNWLRYQYYRRRMKYLGKNVVIDVGVYIHNPQFVSIDDNCWIDRYVVLLAGYSARKRETLLKDNPNYKMRPGELSIGKNAHIPPHCIISAIGGVYIADNVGFASGCKVYSLSHHYRSFKDPANEKIIFSPMVSENQQSMILGPVVFEENVGMALNAVVLPGVTIHKNSFVMINSVVTTDVPPNSVVGGNPARVMGVRFKTSDNLEGN